MKRPNLTITTKATNAPGFKVSTGHESGTMRTVRRLRDGSEWVGDFYDMPEKDFLENYDENEEFQIIDVIKTYKGNKFVISRDCEIDEYYLTKIE